MVLVREGGAQSTQALALEGITVQARRRCTVRPQDGLVVARLWEEARKALQVTAFAENEGLFRFQMRRYARTRDAQSLRVLQDSAQARLTYGQGSPFASLPAKHLLTRGFAERTDSGIDYQTPDAQVLLSDEFLDAYCFRLAEPQRGAEGLVGLSFEPAARRGPAAVRGTLWLDQRTLELRFMEYGYTRVTLPVGAAAQLGGQVRVRSTPHRALDRLSLVDPHAPDPGAIRHMDAGGTAYAAGDCGNSGGGR